MPKRILEGATIEERAKQRRKLGPLRGLTVQPSTKARYTKAVDGFLGFLKFNGHSLPRDRDCLDVFVCEYIEHLWSSGAGRALASDTVAGLQDCSPKLRGSLPGSWRLLKTWSINEVPNRAPPMPEHVLHAMCDWAIFHQQFGFALSLLVGFYGMLRTGELLGVRRKDFCSEPNSRTVLLNLGLTKGGKRAGAAESIILGHDVVVLPLQRWMRLAKSIQPLTQAPGAWRGMFSSCLSSLKIDGFGFRPYSLRRGGATWWFGKHHNLDRILIQGRWQAAKTARTYINEGLAILAQLQIPVTDHRLSPYLKTFRANFTRPTFTALEPPARAGSSGGRGKRDKKKKFSSKPSKKAVFSPVFERGYSFNFLVLPGEWGWPVLVGRK